MIYLIMKKIAQNTCISIGWVIIYLNILISILFIFIDLGFQPFGKFLYINSYKSLITLFLFIFSSIFILGYLDDRKI